MSTTDNKKEEAAVKKPPESKENEGKDVSLEKLKLKPLTEKEAKPEISKEEEELKKKERLKRFGLANNDSKTEGAQNKSDINAQNIDLDTPVFSEEVMKQRKERFKDLYEEEEKEKKENEENKDTKVLEGHRGRILKHSDRKGDFEWKKERGFNRGFYGRERSGGYDRDRRYNNRFREEERRFRGGRRFEGYRK